MCPSTRIALHINVCTCYIYVLSSLFVFVNLCDQPNAPHVEWRWGTNLPMCVDLNCVLSGVQANIYSLRITTNLLAGSYNNDFTFTFILSSCVYSLELSSSAICYMVAYTSSTSHHHQLCSIGTGEAAKAT